MDKRKVNRPFQEKLCYCPQCNFVWAEYCNNGYLVQVDYYGNLPSYGLPKERCPSCTKRMVDGVPIHPRGLVYEEGCCA